MKNFSFLLLVILLIKFSSCSPNKIIMTTDTIQRQWMLKTLPGFSGNELMAAKAMINLTDFNRGGAFAGCNKIFFNVKTGTDNKITITNAGSTKMYCEDKMKMEDALSKALADIVKYEFTAPHQVAFKDASGKVVATAVAADWD